MAMPFKACSVEDCKNIANGSGGARGWCSKHYKRWKKYGDPHLMSPSRMGTRKCTVEGCEEKYHTTGFCTTHYNRWHRFGDPLKGGSRPWKRNAPRKFFNEVVLNHESDECLVWPFTRLRDGRGQLGRKLVHRLVCEATHGPPPSPTHVAAHSCGKGHEGCVSKRHLSWKTPSENRRDMFLHGTMPLGEECVFSKLTEEKVRQIRAMGDSKDRKSIAAMFGVHPDTVKLILQRKTWRHI